MRNHVLTALTLAVLGLAGCGRSTSHEAAEAADQRGALQQENLPAGARPAPAPATSPDPDEPRQAPAVVDKIAGTETDNSKGDAKPGLGGLGVLAGEQAQAADGDRKLIRTGRVELIVGSYDV